MSDKKIEKEKSDNAEQKFTGQLPEPTFMHIISMLATQAMFQLGEIQNPMTGKSEVELNGAKFSIDCLELLKQKTTGNLSTEEEKEFARILADLKMRYVGKSGR